MQSLEESFMLIALEEAKKALPLDVPIGAIITDSNNKIISKAYNLREKNQSSLDHAEIIAIKQACQILQNWRLDNCKIYITLEPCLMCTGAIIESRISTVIFGAYNDLSPTSNFLIKKDIKVYGGILEKNCLNILKSFFSSKR